MPILDGLDESTCEELQEATSKLEENRAALTEETADRIREELDDKDDFDDLEDIEKPVDEETLNELNRVRRKVRYVTRLGCGLHYAKYTDTDCTPDRTKVSEEAIRDAHQSVDEAGKKVRETTPDYIYSGDRLYNDIAGEENQKRVFQDEANRTLDYIEEFADEQGIATPQRETTGTAVAMQVECKYDDQEKQQECLERYQDQFDVKTGLV